MDAREMLVAMAVREGLTREAAAELVDEAIAIAAREPIVRVIAAPMHPHEVDAVRRALVRTEVDDPAGCMMVGWARPADVAALRAQHVDVSDYGRGVLTPEPPEYDGPRDYAASIDLWALIVLRATGLGVRVVAALGAGRYRVRVTTRAGMVALWSTPGALVTGRLK